MKQTILAILLILSTLIGFTSCGKHQKYVESPRDTLTYLVDSTPQRYYEISSFIIQNNREFQQQNVCETCCVNECDELREYYWNNLNDDSLIVDKLGASEKGLFRGTTIEGDSIKGYIINIFFPSNKNITRSQFWEFVSASINECFLVKYDRIHVIVGKDLILDFECNGSIYIKDWDWGSNHEPQKIYYSYSYCKGKSFIYCDHIDKQWGDDVLTTFLDATFIYHELDKAKQHKGEHDSFNGIENRGMDLERWHF